MNFCKHCSSREVMDVSIAHQSDFKLTSVNTGETYVGSTIFLPQLNATDKHLNFTLCVSCGQILGKWKLKVQNVLEKSHENNYEIL